MNLNSYIQEEPVGVGGYVWGGCVGPVRRGFWMCRSEPRSLLGKPAPTSQKQTRKPTRKGAPKPSKPAQKTSPPNPQGLLQPCDPPGHRLCDALLRAVRRRHVVEGHARVLGRPNALPPAPRRSRGLAGHAPRRRGRATPGSRPILRAPRGPPRPRARAWPGFCVCLDGGSIAKLSTIHVFGRFWPRVCLID